MWHKLFKYNLAFVNRKCVSGNPERLLGMLDFALWHPMVLMLYMHYQVRALVWGLKKQIMHFLFAVTLDYRLTSECA